MKHILFIFTLLCALPTIAVETTDKADTTKSVIMGEIVVTGLTGKTRLADSPLPFTVITPQSLQTTAKLSIIDAISNQPGLAQITTGVAISKPVIRGLGYNRVVVFRHCWVLIALGDIAICAFSGFIRSLALLRESGMP